MRILLLWPFFHPDPSGIACAIRGEAFAKYLNKKDVEIFVLVPEKNEVSKDRVVYEGCIVDRVKTYHTIGESHSFILSLLYLPLSVITLIRKVKKIRPNLIIASTPGPFLSFEGLLVAKFLNIPFVFFMADSWHLTRHSHKGFIRTKIKMFIERLCAINADIIFTVTPTLREIISKGYNIPSDNIEIIYSGVDLEHCPRIERSGVVDLIHLGSPRIYYDTVRLIDAFSIINSNLPHTNLKFIGCTDENYVKEIKKYVGKKGLSEKVDFLSAISHEKVPFELSKAKIGVISLIDLPEYTSAIGVKVFEYMAAGLPTAYLGPSESEQERLITENSMGIYASNPIEFAEKVTYLLQNKMLMDKMGENGRESISKYDWKTHVENLYTYIISFCNNTHKKGHF